MKRLLAVLLHVAAVASLAAATLADYQAIHAPLECETAAISPDGKWLACIFRASSKVELRIFDLDAAEAKGGVRIELTPEMPGMMDQILWVSANRVIAQVDRREIVAVDANGKNFKRLVDWQDAIWYDESILGAPLSGLRVVAWSEDAPEFVHVEATRFGRTTMVKIHHGTGKAEAEWRESGNYDVNYDRNAVARVRAATTFKPEGFELRVRTGSGMRWVPLDRVLGTEKQPQFTLSVANAYGPRSVPLGFGRDPDVLYIASNIGRDTFGIYALDLRTRQRTEFALEHPTIDLTWPFLSGSGEPALVRERKSGEVVGARFPFQRTGAVWADAELRAVQERIERLAPDYGVRIENWDDARERFLVRLSNRADPGGFAVYARTQDKLRRYLVCVPPVGELLPAHSTPWSITRADGSTLHGNLVLPPEPRPKPTPVVALMRPAIWGRLSPDFLPEVRALAQMGYAVLEVGHRGIIGQGLRHWESGRGKLEVVIAEDLFAALNRIGPEAGLERRKVALVGGQFGGTVALRLAAQMPDRVACVVAAAPLVDMHVVVKDSVVTAASYVRSRETQRSFFGPEDAQLKAWSPATLATQVRVPVMILAVKTANLPYVDDSTAGAIKKMRAAKNPPLVLEESAAKGRSEMNARISVATEKFLAEHLPLARP